MHCAFLNLFNSFIIFYFSCFTSSVWCILKGVNVSSFYRFKKNFFFCKVDFTFFFSWEKDNMNIKIKREVLTTNCTLKSLFFFNFFYAVFLDKYNTHCTKTTTGNLRNFTADTYNFHIHSHTHTRAHTSKLDVCMHAFVKSNELSCACDKHTSNHIDETSIHLFR